MDRRSLFLGASASLCSLPFVVHAQASLSATDPQVEIIGEVPPLPDDLQQFSNYEPAEYTDIIPYGSGKPDTEEMEKALSILLSSPYQAAPVEVAEYFLNLSGDQARFRREWPVRANPVIYHFFSSTQTAPVGDVTAWCAAFVNWCMLRAQATSADQIGRSPGNFSKSGQPFTADQLRKHSTRSASSGSFRCLKQTTSPKRGDVLVLADRGTLNTSSNCFGKGHVAFFLSDEKGKVLVVGGNQTSPGSGGAVTKALYQGRGSERFFSFVRPLT